MTITFTGDLSITGSFVKTVNINLEIFSDDILSFLSESDFVVVNLEGPTTKSKTYYNYNTPLKSPVDSIKYLKERNINVFNLANNHILDYGEQGLQNTITEINKQQCTYFGAGLNKAKRIEPVLLKKGAISIAQFGITKCNPTKIKNAQLFSSDDYNSLKKQINIYKNKVDFIFINFHGGEEFSFYPSPVKRKFLKRLASINGVDCVIAHHSHTLQGFEKYKNTPIFYSLGNFIFDIPNHKPYIDTDKSALLQFHFTKKDFTFSFFPITIKNGKISKQNNFKFNKRIKELNDFSNYKSKWQEEAYRILFRKTNPLINKNLLDKNSLQEKTFLAALFLTKFYTKSLSILRDKYQFSLYSNAIYYKLKQKIRL